jgi:hypothetical protein
MQGTYVDRSGQVRKGSFGFVGIDLFETGHVPDPQFQTHDWEPGIADSGLFWTTPISPGSIKADPSSGRAQFRVEALKIGDYHDFVNAVSGGTPIPSRVSFDVVWTGGGSAVDLRDETFTFEGHYVPGPARISFVAASDDGSGITYRSVAEGQYNPTLEQLGAGDLAVGTEQNGR